MCGIAGCYGTPHAPDLARWGGYNSQNRGQEFVGFAACDGDHFYPEDTAPLRKEGLVLDILTDAAMRSMVGYMAFVHVRYSTQGASELRSAQPHRAMTSDGPILFASNGDIVNCHQLRSMLKQHDVTFYSENDGEVIVKLIAFFHAQFKGDWIAAIKAAKDALNGSYSGVLMTHDKMFLIRDRKEMRPFCYTIAPDGAIFFGSESAALDIMTADYPAFGHGDYELNEVPGDAIIELSGGHLTMHADPHGTRSLAHCIFEQIYFSRPDSVVFGVPVDEFRWRLGRALVAEAKPSGDLVSPVPESGVVTANAIAFELGLPRKDVINRHHQAPRTFIQPTQQKRDAGVKIKFNPNRRAIRGKRIILVDDSIVHGTTMRSLVHMIKRYDPDQITLLVTCPLILYFCYHGIDIKGNLVAAQMQGDVLAIKKAIGLEEHDVLHFLSLEGLKSCVDDPHNWCYACLSGEYPTDVREFVPLKT